jgi:ArsR family transcriptional regulator, arsenate/arsenite/antimonite-responsive transcriptional repressor
MRTLTRIYKALSDETRLRMMALLLREEELCVCDLMETLEISQSKASRHLRHLALAELVLDRREGVWVYYRVAPALDDDREAILAALTERLIPERTAGLVASLASWRRRKAVEGATCSGSEHDKEGRHAT